MQLHIKDSSGSWYSIDFAFWNSGGSNAPANRLTLYKPGNSGSPAYGETKQIFYNNLRKCWVDYEGTVLASNSNTSGYYILFQDPVQYIAQFNITGFNVTDYGDV
jgi:hypothetical protein